MRHSPDPGVVYGWGPGVVGWTAPLGPVEPLRRGVFCIGAGVGFIGGNRDVFGHDHFFGGHVPGRGPRPQ